MNKQLIINLDLRRRLDKEKELITKYKDYLKVIYVDIPYLASTGNSFICNTNYLKQLNWPKDFALNKCLEMVDFIKSQGIEICIPINGENIHEQELQESLTFINQINPNELAIRKEHQDFYSMNTSAKLVLNRFNTETNLNTSMIPVTLRSTHIKKFGHWVSGVENRILLNYCCPICCPGCTHEYEHDKFFDAEWTTIEEYLAKTVWLSKDIELAEKQWSYINFTYKIASRLWIEDKFKGTKALDNYLESIITNNYSSFLTSAYASVFFINTPFQDKYFKEHKLNNFDWNKFKQFKIDYWSQYNSELKDY